MREMVASSPCIEIADLLLGPNDDDLQCHQPGSSYDNVS